MYETLFFKDNGVLVSWAEEHFKDIKETKEMVDSKSPTYYVLMSDELCFLYETEKSGDHFEISSFDMLLFPWKKSKRKDVFNVQPFFRPEGEKLWHSAIDYGNCYSPLPFVVTNAFDTEAFKQYGKGGCFQMSVTGLGVSMECLNKKAIIRFNGGLPVARRRLEKNDPTIDHADFVMNFIHALNPRDDFENQPAFAEFTTVVEACEPTVIAGQKCFKLELWSGAPNEPESFTWTMLIPRSRIKGRYTPRSGDLISGLAVMFGTFNKVNGKEAFSEPTVFSQFSFPSESMDDQQEDYESDPLNCIPEETIPSVPKGKKEMEYLPRGIVPYPDVKHGEKLHRSTSQFRPGFVLYPEYKAHIKGELIQRKDLSRSDLKFILSQIPEILQIRTKTPRQVFDQIGLMHTACDPQTGEMHIWCAVPPAFDVPHVHTDLLIALDANKKILRYTLLSGDALSAANAIAYTYEEYHENVTHRVKNLDELLSYFSSRKTDDFFAVWSYTHSTMFQGRLEKDGKWYVEWQQHYLPWQFCSVRHLSTERVIELLRIYVKDGITALQCMEPWKITEFAKG